jgi:LuxR family maltose regulon positive regulatory protein
MDEDGCAQASTGRKALLNRDILLDSKTIPPALRPNLVPRGRLLRRLEDGLAAGRELTLISAPAGFGKTTLLAEWARRAGRPVAWLTLEESENDPALFLRYLVESIRKSVETVSPLLPQLLQSPQPASPRGLLPPLLNELARAGPFLMIFDDYHLVTAPAVHALVGFLIEHLPASMHLALGTREDPPLPLARSRARGLVTELREADLRFSLPETKEFLSRSLDLALPAEAAETLEARTEGWVAGLQLAAFALQKEDVQPEKFLAAFSGDHRYVMDYLVVEVLERLPEEIRGFLRRTSILDRLSAPLCDAVIEGSGSQAVLEQLENSNIFLFPLDARREWYRYHRLFAEFLKARLEPREEALLHARAAAWYESRRMPYLAVRHALDAGALTGGYTEAARLIRLAAEDGIREGRAQTLLGWLDSLPKELLLADPELALYKGWAFTLTGNFADAAGLADHALRSVMDLPGKEAVRGKAFLLQAFLALMEKTDYPGTIRLAARAVEDLRGREDQWLPMAHWLLAEPHERMGHIGQAILTLQESRKALPAPLSHLFTDLVDMMLVYDLNLAGRRREALAVCEETIRARSALEEEESSPTSCMLLARQAMLYYESDELDRAHRVLEEAVAYGTRHRQEPFVTFARGISAPILLARGETDAALEALEQAAGFARQTGLTDLGTILAMEANIRLRLGRLDWIAHWAEETGCSIEEEPQYIRLDAHLVFARWLLARGSHAEAGRWLARLRAFLEQWEIRRPLITVHILSALQADRTGGESAAREHLTRALLLSAPEEYIRAFLDEEGRVLELLPAVRGVEPAFTDRLLSGRGTPPPRPSAAATDALPEPLSAREIEILRLVAKGLSNAQIAERLVIALATAKRHMQNIYGKLGVNSRMQAVAEGRRRGMIE